MDPWQTLYVALYYWYCIALESVIKDAEYYQYLKIKNE